MNYFEPKSAAERYAKGRPDFHANTIAHIKDYLKLGGMLNKALDVACGTGLSTKVLLGIATYVYGTDISQQMLSFAPADDRIKYAVAPAENQPFGNNEFDIITVSSGVHWFHIDKFLDEAHRLLKSQGWLVLYENYFISEMEGNETFGSWFPEVYLAKYPSPPRSSGYDWTNENLNPKNFNFIAESRFKNAVQMNKQQLALYFTTQSNIIAAVVSGSTTYEEVEQWLSQELAAFFDTDDTVHTIYYGNWVKFIQRAN